MFTVEVTYLFPVPRYTSGYFRHELDRSKCFHSSFIYVFFSSPLHLLGAACVKMISLYFNVPGYSAQFSPNREDFRLFSHSFIIRIFHICHLDTFSHASRTSHTTEDENTSASTVYNLYLWWMFDYPLSQNAAVGKRCSRITVTSKKFILNE